MIKSNIRKILIFIFTFSKNKNGIKFLLKLQNTLSGLTMEVIKNNEIMNDGIHPKHNITDFHDFFLDNISSESRVLDVGCAYGHISYTVAKKAKTVTAIDLRETAIQSINSNFKKQKNLTFKVSDLFSFNSQEKFDVIIMSNVLEHVDDRIKFLKKASELGSKILLRVPAFERHWEIPYKKSLNVNWKLHSDHYIEHTEKELKNEIKKSGMKVDSFFCKWGNYCCVLTKD